MQFRMSYIATLHKDAPERMCRELWIKDCFRAAGHPCRILQRSDYSECYV